MTAAAASPMLHLAAHISQSTASGWSVFGGLIAWLTLFVLPEFTRQMRRERETGRAFRITRSSILLGGVVLLIVIGGSIGIAQMLDPCSKGDAWLGGLGSVSLVSGLLGLRNLGV